MTDILDRLRAATEGTTPGPWMVLDPSLVPFIADARSLIPEAADTIVALRAEVEALKARVLPRVKPLEWHKSHMPSWNDDWHTVPTGYTIRCADEWGWKWSSPLGVSGYASSPTAAKSEANRDYVDRILSALTPPEV